MALTVTLANLRTRIRNRGEWLDTYISDAEILAMVNASIAQLHNIITGLDPDYFLSSDDSNVVSGTATYALATDCFKPKGVDLLDSNNEWLNVLRFNWAERNQLQSGAGERLWTRYRIEGSNIRLMPTPGWSETNGLRLWYIPTPTVLSADSDTYDGISGFDEWVVLNCCVMCAAKEGSDTSVFMAQKKEVERLVRSAAAIRDIGEPDMVRDVYGEHSSAGIHPDYMRP
jgi:hypothetical protein